MWLRYAVFLALVLLSGSAVAQTQPPLGSTVSNCTQAGGYPFTQGGCWNAADINNSLELSIGLAPPHNSYHQGASQGKLWLDTSVVPARLRECKIAPPGLCSPNYTASQWMEWAAVDFDNDIVDWPIGGGVTTIGSSGVVDIGLYPGAVLQVTGTNAISSFGNSLPIGRSKILVFSGSVPIAHNPPGIVIPGGGTVTTQAGSAILVTAVASGEYVVTLGSAPNTFVGDSGSGGVKGLVPAPAPGLGGNGYLLGARGTWVVPSGCRNILSYGGRGDNTTDNATAFAAAVAASPINPCIYFPSGPNGTPSKYKFLSGVGFTFTQDVQSITIIGDGPDGTELTWPFAVGNALALTLVGQSNSYHIRHLAMTTGTPHADTGIFIHQTTTCSAICISGSSQSDITGVTLRSNEGYPEQNNGSSARANFWLKAIYVLDASWVTFDNVMIYGSNVNEGTGGFATAVSSGTGVLVEGNSATVIPAVFNFNNVSLNNLSNGILVGSYVQGITVTGGSNFTANFAGIGIPAGAPGLAQLTIADSQFANVYNVLSSSTIFGFMFHHNLIIQPTGSIAGLDYPAVSQGTVIDGNTFLGSNNNDAGAGCVLLGDLSAADLSPAIVNNNIFINCGKGVYLNAGASGTRVGSGNIWTGNTTNVVNLGTGNRITGLPGGPAIVSNAVSSGGHVRLTVDSSAQFVTGEMVSIGGVGGVPVANIVTSVTVVDGTHLDLPLVTFSGTYTSGGIVSPMP